MESKIVLIIISAVTVDGVNVVAEMGMTNMFAENGVIIAIDRVLPA